MSSKQFKQAKNEFYICYGDFEFRVVFEDSVHTVDFW